MRSLPALALVALTLILAGCGPRAAGEKNADIVDAEQALELVRDGALLVDVQDFLRYNRAHIAGAVNVSRADIVINYPVPGLVAPPEQIEEVMSDRGIGSDTLVLAYDANANMDAARLWWTLKYYGHDSVKVVSGGLDALEAAGAEITSEVSAVVPAVFKASAPRSEMLIDMAGVREQVEDPEPGTVLIDVRSLDEYTEGTIPGSICLDYTGNNYPDGTYRPVQHIRIRYLEEGIDYNDSVIVYCVTSMRAAQTYLALYNAGYRDIKLYDGGWIEWSADPENPVQTPEEATIRATTSDIS
ncbi:MAG: sulfurtransferase [Spirochaetales bacterium]|nr:sulfurtransferase [Spirochaetales bacterium]